MSELTKANNFTPRVSRDGEPYRLQGEPIMRLFDRLLSSLDSNKSLGKPARLDQILVANIPVLI